MEFVVVLLVLTALVVFVTVPLRRRRAGAGGGEQRADAERRVADLEAAREAKYREIRDAELDHGTGKLSDADFAELDRTLRAEAIEILKALDAAREALAAATAEDA